MTFELTLPELQLLIDDQCTALARMIIRHAELGRQIQLQKHLLDGFFVQADLPEEGK